MSDSATNSWDRTKPGGVARAAVNRTTPTDAAWSDDGVTHLPLQSAYAAPEAVSPPAQPVLDEAELRQRLADALEHKREIEHVLGRASEAAGRSERFYAEKSNALAEFAALDQEVADETVRQLSDGSDAPELPEELHQRIAMRERAKVSRIAAGTALDKLSAEREAAAAKAAEAAREVDRLVASVLAFEAKRIAQRQLDLLKQADTLKLKLFEFNMFAANRITALPPDVRVAIGNDHNQLARARDLSAWKDAAASLRDDPNAVISVET